MNLFILFLEFFKVGLFAIGGGMATLPFLYDLAGKYPQFLSEQMLADMIAVSESTPGPIGVNCATYVGYNFAGVLGGIVATLGLIMPSIIIILIIAKALDKYSESKYVKNAFYGLRPVVASLVSCALVSILKSAFLPRISTLSESFNIKQIIGIVEIPALILFAVLFAITRRVKIHPIFIILLSAVIGIIFKFQPVL